MSRVLFIRSCALFILLYIVSFNMLTLEPFIVLDDDKTHHQQRGRGSLKGMFIVIVMCV